MNDCLVNLALMQPRQYAYYSIIFLLPDLDEGGLETQVETEWFTFFSRALAVHIPGFIAVHFPAFLALHILCFLAVHIQSFLA